MLDLCTLGTGGALPLPERGLSSLYVRLNGRGVLVDCGEATQTAIRILGWGFRSIDALLITHFHADHCGGLPGFLLSMGKSGRDEPFHIYGPAGLRNVVNGLRVIAPALPFEVVLHEFDDVMVDFSVIGLNVTAFHLNHGVPCYGYRFDLKRPPAFDPQKARANGVPVPLWSILQKGETAEHDGKTYTPDLVMGAARRGLSFVYATDTRPVTILADMGYDTDLMILEGMYGNDEKMSKAIKNHHMLFREAAALARDAETKRLLLTHFSNCIEDPAEYLPKAQCIFPNTDVASDGMAFTLRFDGDR